LLGEREQDVVDLPQPATPLFVLHRLGLQPEPFVR
jgi:hypothetical protein